MLTVKQLYDQLKELVDSGKSETAVTVDTEARRFNVHMVDIAHAFFESGEHMSGDQDLFILYPDTSLTERIYWDEDELIKGYRILLKMKIDEAVKNAIPKSSDLSAAELSKCYEDEKNE